MNTGTYITSDDILAIAAPMVGDMEFKNIPRGFYYSLIQKAFEELNLDSYFQELRTDLDFPDNLVLDLPEGCFNVKNIYVYDGDFCDIGRSRKVWWKRNYSTNGKGYIANDKGNNHGDPYYASHGLNKNVDKTLIRYDNSMSVNSELFYNIQMGKLMFSSSCKSAGRKVHIHYNGTGCAIGDAPIIPVYFRTAMEDYVIEAALRFRMANDSGDIRKWQMLNSAYRQQLDKDGMDGSWFKAIMRVREMNSSQREELATYLGRGGWASGY